MSTQSTPVRQINAAGEALIKSFEGLVLTAGPDIVGISTVGWGHTGHDVHNGMHITVADAENLFHVDMRGSELAVMHMVKVPLTDNQFAALVSLVFNVGLGCLISTTHLAKNLAMKNYPAAAESFLSWDHAGGKQVRGLTRRRIAERELFLKP